MTIPNRLRVAGLSVLIVGLLIAGLLYATRLPDDEDVEFASKRETLQMERIDGKANVLASELRQWFVGLWQGQKLAFTLAYLSVGGCGVCLVLAAFSSVNDRTAR